MGGDDASREDRDAPGARRASVECCRGIRQRDRPPGGGGAVNRSADAETASPPRAGGGGAVNRSADAETARRRRAGLAIAGRAERRGAGSPALYRRRQEAGPPPSRRARLGGGPPRA